MPKDARLINTIIKEASERILKFLASLQVTPIVFVLKDIALSFGIPNLEATNPYAKLP